jgi:hypothetical protein
MASYASLREGLAVQVAPGDRGGSDDFNQTTRALAAARTVLGTIVGGAAIYQGGAAALADLGDGTTYPAVTLLLADDAGRLWAFTTTTAAAIDFRVEASSAARLYARPVLLTDADPAAARGGLGDLEFLADDVANPAPSHALLLGTGTITDGAFTAYTPEDLTPNPLIGGGGGGAVTSVNEQTGDVVLDAADVGADPEGAAAGAVSAHEGASDPHPDYQLESEKGAAGGYAGLDETGKVPAAQLPGGTGVPPVIVADDPRLTLRDTADGDAESYLERTGGVTRLVAEIAQASAPATAKPAWPTLNGTYTVPGESNPLATDLLVDYVLNEGMGGTAGDLATGNHDGTITGPTWGTDSDALRSPKLTFDGSNDYVACGDVANFEYNQSFSVFVRFRTSNGGSGVEQVLLGRMTGTPYAQGWIVLTYEGRLGLNLAANQLSPYQSLGVWTTATSFCDGNWHDAVLTYNGGHNAAAIDIFVDGEPVAHEAWTDTLGANSITNSENFHLGIRDADSAYPLNGDLAHVTLWDRVLSADEAAALTDDPYRLEGAGGGGTLTAVEYLRVEPTGTTDHAKVILGGESEAVQITGVSLNLPPFSVGELNAVWAPGTYTAGSESADGWVEVVINGETYRLLAKKA